MTEYERARTMPALPEHTFDQAADVDELNAWLPQGLNLETGELPSVTVQEGATHRDVPAILHVHSERMRLEWGSRDEGGYTGWLQVTDTGSGVSEVTVHLSFTDGSHDPGEQAVHAALDGSLERLEEQVRLRIDNVAG
ncbi:SRPBCC family protein [Streptomyces sp. NPDC001822]|uniref:SRPBCC family protein n=1 Tax=Streptomyces sp. NPDC001822 TaxID=3364614 RepID=UPI0036C34FC6